MFHRISPFSFFAALFVFSATMTPLALPAQSCQLFTIADALPSTLLNDIIEDSDNFIWVATEYGLCKYDGSKFTVYQNEPGNIHSLQSNYVRSLFVDHNGHLLVGTRAGLQVYRPASDDFTAPAVFEISGRESGDVARIIERQNGEIWLSGNTSCCARFSPDGNPVLYPNAFTDVIDYTETLVEDNVGRIWTNRRMESVYRLEVSGQITTVGNDGQKVPFNSLSLGADGMIYAGGQLPGLYRFNIKTDSFEMVSDPGNSSFLLCDICNLDEQNLLIATDNEGLKMFNYRTGEIEPYMFDDGRIDPLTQKVHAVWVDHNHDIWLALYQKGVLLIEQTPQPFRFFGAQSGRYNCVGDKCVTSISMSSDGWAWVSTDNGGLYAVDSEGRQMRNFPYTGAPGTIPPSLATVFEDSRHRLWYGAFAKGYGWVDKNTGRCTSLGIRGNTDTSSSIFAFAEDHKGRIWAATMGQGVYCFDEQSQMLGYHVASDSCRWSHCIYFEPMRRKLYVGSYNGLTEIDVIDDMHTVRQFLGQYIIYAISPYTSGRLALCTSQGLVLFDMNTCQSVTYSVSDGLPSDLVYAAECDGNGLLWLTTNVGLTCFNERRGSFTNFSIRDGLQRNEFYKNASMRDDDGMLWFGGTGGLTLFNPLSVSHEGMSCDVRIVGITAGGRRVPDIYDREFDDNSFSFEMAAIPIGLTHHVSYSYSMDNDPWTTLPEGHNQISFSRLAPGRHTFRYKAQMGEFVSGTHQLPFSVSYPWYQSWWVCLIALVLVVLIAVLTYNQLSHRRKVRKRLMSHIQAQTINEERLRFFANITTQIRTPLTMIMSPLQSLIDADASPERRPLYGQIQHNADRIVELINKLLEQYHIDEKIVLPKRSQDIPDEGIAMPISNPSYGSRLVVVADSDDEMRHFIASELSSAYRIVECSSGTEAFDQMMHLVPDLLICDASLPQMDGMELCHRVRRNVRINHIPVIMLSALSTEDVRVKSLEVGVDAFMAKPFNMKVLRCTVQNLVQSRERLRNAYSGQQMPTDQVVTPESKSPDERLMERIMKVVNQNLNNPELTSEMIASEVGISRVHLYRKLKELTNQSSRNFIRNIRLAKAAELLAQKKVSVSEVADKVGFPNSSNFATAFKELYGMTPTAYMSEHLQREHSDSSET